MVVHSAGMILCKERADSAAAAAGFRCYNRGAKACGKAQYGNRAQVRRRKRVPPVPEDRAMRLIIEIVAAVLLVICVSVSSAAFAAGKAGRSADGLGCSFSVAKARPPPRAAPRSSGNAAESSTPIIAATRCCRRSEITAPDSSSGKAGTPLHTLLSSGPSRSENECARRSPHGRSAGCAALLQSPADHHCDFQPLCSDGGKNDRVEIISEIRQHNFFPSSLRVDVAPSFRRCCRPGAACKLRARVRNEVRKRRSQGVTRATRSSRSSEI